MSQSSRDAHTQLVSCRLSNWPTIMEADQPAFWLPRPDRREIGPFLVEVARCDLCLAEPKGRRSAAKLFFSTSIKLITFSAGGTTVISFLGSAALFSLSLEIKTVRYLSSRKTGSKSV